MIHLILTRVSDIDLVMSWEAGEKNVLPWPKEKHKNVLADPGFLHFMVCAVDGKKQVPVGYSILRKSSPDADSVEFIRLVISDGYKNRGLGKQVFYGIWDLVFNKFKYGRIWHDVFLENEGAIRLYEKLGYEKFGDDLDPKTGRKLVFFELTKDKYSTFSQVSFVLASQ